MCPRVNPKAWWPVASEGSQNSLSFLPRLPVLHLSFSTHKWLSPSPLLTAIPHSFFLQRIAQRTTLGGRRSFDCWLSKAIITAASAGYENDFRSVKPVSLPGWPWCRRGDGIERGKQMRSPLSPPGSNRTKWITHSNGKISDGNTCPRCLEGSTLHENSLLNRI